MNRIITIASIIGLLLVGFISYFLGRHSVQTAFEDNSIAEVTSIPSPIVIPTPIPTVLPSPPTLEPIPIPTLPPTEIKMSLGFFSLKSEIEAAELDINYHFMATADHRYEVLEMKAEQALINFNGLKGWIPAWYLKQNPTEPKVIAVKPYLMIVNTPTSVLLYPEAQAVSGAEFEVGKVLQIYKEYGEWVCVRFINYAEPNYGDYWVLKTALIAWDPKKAKEGYLKKGTAKKYQDMQENANIKINAEGSETYSVNSSGGVTREIAKEDFVPNPFINYPETLQASLSLIDDLELSPDLEKTYTSYTLKRSDTLLKGMSAADIFKFYLEATFRNDQETIFALLISGDGYDTHSHESFLQDLKTDPTSSEKSIALWKDLKQNNTFVIQENYMEANHAVIFIRPLNDEAEMKVFQMNKNKAGIWKINWMALQ